MVALGNFLFHYRNLLFPVFYLFLFVPLEPLLLGHYRLALYTGLGVALLGQAVRIATIGLKYIIRGGRHRRVYAEDLITEGLFAHTRNPLYVGNVLILIGLGIMSNSLWFSLILSPLFVFFYQAIIRAEEHFLHQKFGAAFDQYCRDTQRWLPRLAGLTATLRSMTFHWRRVIVKEYTATFIWLSGAVLLWGKYWWWQEPHLWDSSNQQFLIYAMIALLTLYLLTRYLKKSGKLKRR